MANLKKFVWEGSTNGMKFGIYEYRSRLRIGGGELLKIAALHLHATGGAAGFSGSVEIIMPDEAPNGVCSVILNNDRRDNVPYATVGNKLVITDPRTKIELDTERMYTWIGIDRPVSMKVGLWPEGYKMDKD